MRRSARCNTYYKRGVLTYAERAPNGIFVARSLDFSRVLRIRRNARPGTLMRIHFSTLFTSKTSVTELELWA